MELPPPAPSATRSGCPLTGSAADTASPTGSASPCLPLTAGHPTRSPELGRTRRRAAKCCRLGAKRPLVVRPSAAGPVPCRGPTQHARPAHARPSHHLVRCRGPLPRQPPGPVSPTGRLTSPPTWVEAELGELSRDHYSPPGHLIVILRRCVVLAPAEIRLVPRFL